jgi:hypothetical protein
MKREIKSVKTQHCVDSRYSGISHHPVIHQCYHQQVAGLSPNTATHSTRRDCIRKKAVRHELMVASNSGAIGFKPSSFYPRPNPHHQILQAEDARTRLQTLTFFIMSDGGGRRDRVWPWYYMAWRLQKSRSGTFYNFFLCCFTYSLTGAHAQLCGPQS